MKLLKQIIFYLALSIVINWVCITLESNVFATYLRDNILALLITLLAINTATISVIVAKLHEISRLTGVKFEKTISEVKQSLYEQIILIISSSIILIFYNSPIVKANFLFHEIFFNILITTVFIYALDILRDTGVAIFDILKFPSGKSDE